MTLDTLTRAQAEVSHVRLKNSLVQTSQTFREHFRAEKELFRTIAGSDATVVPSTRPRTSNTNSPKTLAALPVPLHTRRTSCAWKD